MKTFNKVSILFISVIALGFLFLAPAAFAATPTLSVYSTGSGDNVQINVTGDADSSVLLFYQGNSVGYQFTTLGSTDSSGSFTTTISSATYSIISNSSAYVVTGGINGPRSSTVTWPYVQSSTTATGNALSLSQSAILINVGQTSTITSNISYLYILSNSSPAVANVNINAGQISIQALSYGTTAVKICAVGSTTNCATVNVTAQNSTAQQLTFSQNNFSLFSGQNATVTISGGSGNYIISNNSNSSSLTASISGSVVTVTATSTSGTSAITVCTTDMQNCGIINANATTVNSTAISFSQTNPVVTIGQSTTVTIFGGSGNNFYVSSNSNPSLVQVNITNNVITLIANASTGSSTITICAYAGSCATLTANVSNTTVGGAIALSQTSVSILAGQSTNITISGGSAPYTATSNSANVFNTNISGNLLTVYGVNAGSGTADICSSSGCTPLSITVTSSASTTNPPAFSQNNILLTIGQQSTINITGTGNYYVSNNSSPGVASVQININSMVVNALYAGSTNIAVCQSGGQCSVLYVTVSNPAPVQPVVVVTAYVLPRFLGVGDKGEDVFKLQQLLVEKGYLKAVPNGYFGNGTKAAIKKFQAEKGIRQTGNVGQSTKEALNKLWVASGSASTDSKAQQIQQIQDAIKQLLAQAAQMQGQ